MRPNGDGYFGSNYSNAYTKHSASTYDRKGSMGPFTPSSVNTQIERKPADDLTSVMTKGRMIGDFPGDFERMGVRVDTSFSVHTGALSD